MTAARRSISPGLIFLAIALIGSVLFALYAVTVRDASQIPLLAAGSAVLGIVFIALAFYALRSIWRAGLAGRSGKALALGVGGLAQLDLHPQCPARRDERAVFHVAGFF